MQIQSYAGKFVKVYHSIVGFALNVEDLTPNSLFEVSE
jgi:hypothetical protein